MLVAAETDDDQQREEAMDILTSMVREAPFWGMSHHEHAGQTYFALDSLDHLVPPVVAVARAEHQWLRSGTEEDADSADAKFAALIASVAKSGTDHRTLKA